jgi:hypothetical protein
MQLGTEQFFPGIFATLGGGRIINGSDHTIKTSGTQIGGRLISFSPESVVPFPALTNEGTILADRGAELQLHMNADTHFNFGAIECETQARLSLLSNVRATFRNHGLISAADQFGVLRIEGVQFVNESDGILRASNAGTIRLPPPPNAVVIRNAGLIEAVERGVISIEGKNIVNETEGVIQARSGGIIELNNGTFLTDESLKTVDQRSMITIRDSLVENEGSVLTPGGPGILRLQNSAHVRGGEVNAGPGTLVLNVPTMENVTLSGAATGAGIGLKGTINFDSNFSLSPRDVFPLALRTRGDAVLQGTGLSRFGFGATVELTDYTLEVASEHRAEFDSLDIRGKLRNNGLIKASSVSVSWFPDFETEGVLSGTGAFETSALDVQGIISPGNGIGTMSVDGEVLIRGTPIFFGTLVAELGDSQSDLLQIKGRLRLDGQHDRLDISGGLVNQNYVVVQYTGERWGVFDEVTPGYNVVYDDLAKEIRVQPIPEPGSVVLAVVGGIAVGVLWLRKRRRGASVSLNRRKLETWSS